jgi:hypothetical protein
MVMKKKSTAGKSTTVEQAVEKAGQGAGDGDRQKRLRALREKYKDKPAGAEGPGAGGKPGWQMKGGGAGAGDRKSQIVKKLIKKRMEKGGGQQEVSGEKLGQYPRLKALLEKRGGQTGDDLPVDLVELEGRVSRLENALESVLEKLVEARIIKS